MHGHVKYGLGRKMKGLVVELYITHHYEGFVVIAFSEILSFTYTKEESIQH